MNGTQQEIRITSHGIRNIEPVFLRKHSHAMAVLSGPVFVHRTVGFCVPAPLWQVAINRVSAHPQTLHPILSPGPICLFTLHCPHFHESAAGLLRCRSTVRSIKQACPWPSLRKSRFCSLSRDAVGGEQLEQTRSWCLGLPLAEMIGRSKGLVEIDRLPDT